MRKWAGQLGVFLVFLGDQIQNGMIIEAKVSVA